MTRPRAGWLWLCAAGLLAACALKRPAQPIETAHLAVGVPVAQPTVPVTPPPPVPAQANFFFVVSDAVASSQDDIGSYTKIFVDNLPAGETQIAARSQDKVWAAALPPGNHLFRFEKWDLPDTGDWTMLDPQYQPQERFIRVKPGQKTVARLKFYDGGTQNELTIERQPLPPQR